MHYPITFEANPSQDDIQCLYNGISAHAKHQKGIRPLDFFAYFVRDQKNNILGGCNGNTLYGCLYIDSLWVADSLRGKGYGTKLVRAAEQYGLEHGCTFAAVNTMDWEALGFYKKLGFEIEFERHGFIQDSIFYFLRKSLISGDNTLEQKTLTPHIISATLADYHTIQNMARFYVYEMSRTCGLNSMDWACPDDGLYESFDFKSYFEDSTRKAFLIKADVELAGFCLLNKTRTSENTDWNMGEFFILARFQRKGFGSRTAKQIFSSHPGQWEVSIIPENQPALKFWRNIVGVVTNGNYSEEIKNIDYDHNQPERYILTFNIK